MSNSKNGLKSGHVLEIMNYIEDEYIESALKRLDYMGNKYTEKKFVQKKPKMYFYTFAKRVAIFIGIVVLATTTTVATAMAVNEDFRETVKEFIFEFLHIEEEETVPQLPGTEEVSIDTMYVEPDRSFLGGVIEGRYVHTPVSCNAREGVYVICTDEIEMNQGSHYDAYYEENGEFIKLKEQTFQGDYSVFGQNFHLEFDWVLHNGQVVITYVGVEEPYRIPVNPGDSDAMLVELLCSVNTETGEKVATAYPVFINLETGELMDVLAGTGAEMLGDLCNQAVSKDGSKMLLAQSDGTLYYVDLVAKELYSVEELSGERADACSLIGDTLACWVLKDGQYRAWNVDLETLERKEVFTGNPNVMYLNGFDTIVHWGTMFTGSHFALEVDENSNVTVIDLATGERFPVEGFTWPADQYQDVLWECSPDGKRLLISGGEIGLKYEYIGVLDFEKMQYLEFERVNPNEVYEWKPYWFDKDTVIIQATSKDSYYVQDYYVYDIQGTKAQTQEIVKKLMAVQEKLKTEGLYLKIWDAFRPPAAQFTLWEAYPDAAYVSDPNTGFSSHSKGNTVDVTLVNAEGIEMIMPTDFDDFTTLADRDYSDCSNEAAKNAMLLENLMEENGFKLYQGEWWHYSDTVSYDVEQSFTPVD